MGRGLGCVLKVVRLEKYHSKGHVRCLTRTMQWRISAHAVQPVKWLCLAGQDGTLTCHAQPLSDKGPQVL